MKKLIVPFILFIALCFGQLDPTGGKIGSTFDLYEAGKKVGEIYVPGRFPGTTHYLEHWVLFPGYVYPGPKSLVTLKIVPRLTSPYEDEHDFFRRVRFEPGSKYVRVAADEFTRMPRVP